MNRPPTNRCCVFQVESLLLTFSIRSSQSCLRGLLPEIGIPRYVTGKFPTIQFNVASIAKLGSLPKLFEYRQVLKKLTSNPDIPWKTKRINLRYEGPQDPQLLKSTNHLHNVSCTCCPALLVEHPLISQNTKHGRTFHKEHPLPKQKEEEITGLPDEAFSDNECNLLGIH